MVKDYLSRNEGPFGYLDNNSLTMAVNMIRKIH